MEPYPFYPPSVLEGIVFPSFQRAWKHIRRFLRSRKITYEKIGSYSTFHCRKNQTYDIPSIVVKYYCKNQRRITLPIKIIFNITIFPQKNGTFGVEFHSTQSNSLLLGEALGLKFRDSVVTDHPSLRKAMTLRRKLTRFLLSQMD
jgi:hypothetical protein